MSQNTLIIIPSRLAAQRFHRKPLTPIQGKPMVIRVWEQAMKANIGPVIVACCAQEVKDIIEKAGGIALLTDPSLPSGTDRIYQALEEFDPQKKYKIILNVQGDLPTLDPKDIQKTLNGLLAQKEMDIGTLACPIFTDEEKNNPNIVKAIIGNLKNDIGQAFYFTRTAVPSSQNQFFHHVGIYAFRRPALEAFVRLQPSPLEKQESLEQLRALEAGYRFAIHVTDSEIFGVDTQEDVIKAEKLLNRLGWD